MVESLLPGQFLLIVSDSPGAFLEKQDRVRGINYGHVKILTRKHHDTCVLNYP